MYRAILTAAALLCVSQTAFAQELTSAQRDACMGDYREILQKRRPRRWTHHRLPCQGERQTHARLQEGAGGGGEKVIRRPAVRGPIEIGVPTR